MRRKSMYVYCFIFMSYSCLFAQIDTGDGSNPFNPEYLEYHTNSVPPTPNAASFTIYGDTPINTATGIPQISIPLFSIEQDGVSVPISLSYHASGVKVDDLASVVGLKWTLSAGGGIYREVKDKQDEVGWLDPNLRGYIDPAWVAIHPLSEEENQALIGFSDNTHDYYPDDYNYNFPGGGGNFIFSQDGSVIEEYQTPLDIQKTAGIGNTFNFRIADASGNTFFFDDESAREFNRKNVISGGPSEINHDSEANLTGWMLNRIVTKNNKQIDFTYQQYLLDYTINDAAHNIVRAVRCPVDASPTCGCQGSGGGFETSTTTTNISYTTVNRLISSIDSENVLVTFNYTEDTSLADWQTKLTSIEIKDKITNKTKSFVFTYGVFEGNARLRLDQVQEIGYEGTTKPPYKFNYVSGNLPEIGNTAKDIYGYYNGQNNSTLIPYSQEIINTVGTSYTTSLANRNLNETYLKRGVLNKITYPTGGSTDFIYEANAVPVTQNVDGIGSATVSPTSYDTKTIEGVHTVFRRFFQMEGTTIDYTSYSSICDTSNPTAVNSECSTFNIYPAAGDGALVINAEPLFTPEPYIGPSGGLSALEQGWYFVELTVKTSDLVDPVSGNPIYPIPSIGVNVSFPVIYEDDVLAYRGGLRVKNVIDKDTDGTTLKETRYSYEGLHGYVFGGNIKGYNNGAQAVFSSDNIASNPLLIRSGHYYDKVTIENVGDNEVLKTVEYFQEKFYKNSRDAQMIRRELYKAALSPSDDDILVQRMDMQYENTTQNTVQFYTLGDRDFCFTQTGPVNQNADGEFLGYNNPNSVTYFFNRKYVQSQSREITYFYDDQNNASTSIQISNYTYNDNLQMQSQEIEGRYYATDLSQIESGALSFDADGEHTLVNYTYANDHTSEDPVMPILVNKNCISLPVSRTITRNGLLTAGQFFDFDTNANVIASYKYNKGLGSNTASAGHIPSNYDLFADFIIDVGKAVEIQRENDSKTVLIWDNSNNYLLAQIENATSYSSIASLLGSNLNAQGLTSAQENALRALPNTLVTTFKYDPLIGVTSQTDPRGYTSYYEYDDLNRLELVKDQDGNIYSKNEYHYNINN